MSRSQYLGRARRSLLVLAAATLAVAGPTITAAAAAAAASTAGVGPATVSGAATWTRVQPVVSPPSRDEGAMVYDPATSSVVLVLDHTQLGYAETWTWDGTTWTEQHPATSPPESVLDLVGFDPVTNTVLLVDSTYDGTWSWDGTTWSQLHPATQPDVGWASMSADPATGSVVVFGGVESLPDGPLTVNDTWTWDGTNWTLQHPATSPPVRGQAQMAYDPANHDVVLYGGWDAGVTLSDTWTWDGTSWTQHHPSTSPPPVQGGAMAFDPAIGSIVLEGGIAPVGAATDTWSWDGTTWSALHPTSDPNPRYRAAMAYDAAHSALVLFGGVPADSPSGQAQNDTWLYGTLTPTPATTWTQLDVPASPPARRDAALGANPARDGVGAAMMFGGTGASGTLGDTWGWDGNTWTQNSGGTPSSPPAASLGSIVGFPPDTSSSSRSMLMFGGRDANGHALGDTWTWGPLEGWAKASTPTGPPARYAASMASTGNTVVLFGGTSGSGVLGDTWVWKAGWTAVQPPSSPPSRQGATMAFNPDSGLVVLFGGTDAAGHLLGDTWTWDGTVWTQLHPAASPSARSGAALVFDAGSRTFVLQGGTDSAGTQADTWTFDGTTWTQLHPMRTPGPRTGAATVYDPQHATTMVVGGTTPTGLDQGTWVLTPPPAVTTALTVPASDQTTVDPSRPFRWPVVPNAQGYALAVGTTRFGHDILATGVLPPTQTSYSLALPVDQTLHATLLTEIGGVWTFHERTFNSPHGGLLSQPLPNALGPQASQLTWSPDGLTTAQAYLLVIGSKPFAADLASSGVLPQTRTSFTTGPLPAGRTLYATLVTETNNTWATYSTVTFALPGPPPSTFLYPTNGQTGVDLTKPFVWTPSTNAQAYALAVGTTKFGTDLVRSPVLPPDQTALPVPSTLPAGRTLYATILTEVAGAWTYSAITFIR